MQKTTRFLRRFVLALAGMSFFVSSASLFADGKVFAPLNYKGSLEERAQEAIIVFTPGTEKKSAEQEMILKISVEGEVKDFGWVVPFPSEPKTTKEDPKLFEELYSYVQQRQRRPTKTKGANKAFGAAESDQAKADVKVLSRKVVGSYDVAVVQEQVAGSLNKWLKKEGYQPLEDAEDVIGFYRKKKFVFACIKVADTKLSAKNKKADLHPLRFTFKTGGRDGIFFPMRMTGLQEAKFDVNLYVFYQAWLNDDLNGFGYEHRGFSLKYRDWDSPQCKANAGKTWSLPKKDPFLKNLAHVVPTVTKYFQKRHPGERFYLTNIIARELKPSDVREWKNDLWMFPYYTDKKMIPYDAREGGPAAK